MLYSFFVKLAKMVESARMSKGAIVMVKNSEGTWVQEKRKLLTFGG